MNIPGKLVFCSLLLLWTCRPAEENSDENARLYPAYFQELLQAHGGLEQWSEFGSMQFQLTSNGNTETHIIDLKNRKDLIKADTFSIGYDGKEVWVSPDKAAYPGKSARFYHNLYFYFYAIPFVLADPGVKHEQLDKMELNGKNYNVISATFDEEVGETPEDIYRLLIDPESNRLEWVLYTVTFFDGKRNDQFNALKYEHYQEHQGLLFPQELTGYAYENGQIGGIRYNVKLENLQLKEQQPDQQQFEMPKNAEVDSI